MGKTPQQKETGGKAPSKKVKKAVSKREKIEALKQTIKAMEDARLRDWLDASRSIHQLKEELYDAEEETSEEDRAPGPSSDHPGADGAAALIH